MIKKISIKEVEFVAFELARELMSYSEPIPDFITRFPNALESCLAAPFYTFEKKNLYKGLVDKASILFYLMVKNHPFQNGNKRIAMAALMFFLHKNKKWLRVDEREFYNFAVWVASSNPKLKEDTINATARFLRTYLIDLK